MHDVPYPTCSLERFVEEFLEETGGLPDGDLFDMRHDEI